MLCSVLNHFLVKFIKFDVKAYSVSASSSFYIVGFGKNVVDTIRQKQLPRSSVIWNLSAISEILQFISCTFSPSIYSYIFSCSKGRYSSQNSLYALSLRCESFLHPIFRINSFYVPLPCQHNLIFKNHIPMK